MATILEAGQSIDAEASRTQASRPSHRWSGIGPRCLTDPLRQLQKRVNPLILTFAGRCGPYGIVRHVGRRSGRQYATPVAVRMLGDDFVIPLPYSTGTDWWRNLEAAGGGQLRWAGRTYAVGAPELIDRETALPAFPRPVQAIGRLLGMQHFLRLRRRRRQIRVLGRH